MKTNIFDCVKMKDSIQEDIDNDIKNLAPEKQIAYYQNAIKECPALKDKLAKIRQTKISGTLTLPSPSGGGTKGRGRDSK